MGWQEGKEGNECDDQSWPGLAPECTPEIIKEYYDRGTESMVYIEIVFSSANDIPKYIESELKPKTVTTSNMYLFTSPLESRSFLKKYQTVNEIINCIKFCM